MKGEEEEEKEKEIGAPGPPVSTRVSSARTGRCDGDDPR